jgi:predicted Rossmann fold nucleotide-binding protein DprA/Smf involved in DNA uptake
LPTYFSLFQAFPMPDSPPKPIIVAVIGSRTFTNYAQLAQELDKLALTTPIAGLASGGAIGADQLVRRYASERGLPLQEFLPDYARYGRRAPLQRNRLIIEAASLVIGFHDGLSKGTAHSLRIARALGVPAIVVVPE